MLAESFHIRQQAHQLSLPGRACLLHNMYEMGSDRVPATACTVSRSLQGQASQKVKRQLCLCFRQLKHSLKGRTT